MKQTRIAATAALILLASAAWAQSMNVNSIRINNRIVSVGDSPARLFAAAGEPHRVVQLENRHGGATGSRYEYYYRDRAITVEVSGGRVSLITTEVLR